MCMSRAAGGVEGEPEKVEKVETDLAVEDLDAEIEEIARDDDKG